MQERERDRERERMQERERATTTNNKQQTIICIEPFCPSPPALRTPALRTTLMGCCPHRSASREDGELSADQGSSDSTESRRSPEEAAWPGSPTPPPAWVSRLQQQVEFERGRAAWAARRDEASWAVPTLPPFHLSRSWLPGYRDPPSSTLRTPLCPTRTTEERLTQPGSPQGGHPNCPGSPNCPGHMRCQVWARATDTAAKLRNFLHRRGRRAYHRAKLGSRAILSPKPGALAPF